MNILEKKAIVLTNEGAVQTGLVYIKEYSIAKTKTGSEYVQGIAEVKGSIQFKSWGQTSAFLRFKKILEEGEGDCVPFVAMVEAKTNKWEGSTSLIISDFKLIDEESMGIRIDDFFNSRYNEDVLWDSFLKELTKYGKDIVDIFEKVMTSKIAEDFKKEFASSYHHDNFKSGLLAHTLKVLKIGQFIKLYPNISNSGARMELIALGCALHDVGKILEYQVGTTSPIGKILSHHTLGVEMLLKNKDYIVTKKGEDFFLRLLSVVVGHHGEWGERPRTVEAFVIHWIDNFESRMQGLDQYIEEGKLGSKYDGFILN